MQHKSQTNDNEIIPSEEQRRLLCCNKVICRCSSFGFQYEKPETMEEINGRLRVMGLNEDQIKRLDQALITLIRKVFDAYIESIYGDE